MAENPVQPQPELHTIELPAQIYNALDALLPKGYRFRFGSKDSGRTDTLIFQTIRGDQLVIQRGKELSLDELVRMWWSHS